MPPVDPDRLPASLLERFSDDGAPCRDTPGMMRRIALAHFRQHLLGWNTAVHHPDAPRLAVLRFDFAKEAPQRLAVARVARQDLIGQRQPVWRDHQGDHHLRTVRALVSFWHGRRINLEIGAGQIVEQHIEAGVEHIPPAARQVAEQFLLILKQPVVTGIKLVRPCAAQPGRSPPRAGLPWRSCRTNPGAASTRCPSQQAPHWRGRHSRISDRRTCTAVASAGAGLRSSGESASLRCSPVASSIVPIERRQASS